MENLTLTQITERLQEFIWNTQSDIGKDWNEESELFERHLLNLIIAKNQLDLILKTGNQIFKSSISK
jgi:hypothetical protein